MDKTKHITLKKTSLLLCVLLDIRNEYNTESPPAPLDMYAVTSEQSVVNVTNTSHRTGQLFKLCSRNT